MPGNPRLNITKDGVVAVISLEKHGMDEQWLLTGFHDNKKSTDAVIGSVDPNNPTQADHHFTYTDLGAVLNLRLPEYMSTVKTPASYPMYAVGDDNSELQQAEESVKNWRTMLQDYRYKRYESGGDKFGKPMIVGATPVLYQNIGNWYGERVGLRQQSMTTMADTIQKIESGKDARGIPTREPITGKQLELMPAYLFDPVMIFVSDNEYAPKGSLIVMLDMLDGDNLPVLVAIHKNDKVKGYELVVNRIATAYGKDGMAKWVNDQISGKNRFGKNTLIAVNKNKGIAKDLMNAPLLRANEMAAVAIAKSVSLQQQPLIEQYISQQGGAVNIRQGQAHYSLASSASDAIDFGQKTWGEATGSGIIKGILNLINPADFSRGRQWTEQR
jgi:hypothetical protein